jgi:hypothetical protein
MRIILFPVAILLFTGCNYKIVRSGYKTDKSQYKTCDVVISKNITVSEPAKKLGEIELKDGGFTSNCSEAEAVRLLKNEGCAINANVIVITAERRADFGSSCYRCKAAFYQVEGTEMLRGDSTYSHSNLKIRVNADKQRNAAMITAGIVGGLVGGILAAVLFAGF